MTTKIIIAAHKPTRIPKDDMYSPLQVGAKGKASIGFARDDEGDNISEKNPNFCELTGLYFAWKNVDCDVLGLVHYRRYFSSKSVQYRRFHGNFGSVLTKEEIEEILATSDIIVPIKRKYYIETLYSHYAHTHDSYHLDLARRIIRDKCPEYLPYVDETYSRPWGYMFNMFIAPKKLMDEYCEWMFDILFDLEPLIDTSGMDAFSARLFGRVSEILFNAWLLKKQEGGLRIAEVPVIDMQKINWTMKIAGFLSAKFLGKKYNKSM